MIAPGGRGPPIRQIEGDWYVRTDVVAALDRKLALLQGRAFLVTDQRGDCPLHTQGELGFYWRGTRHLSILELRLSSQRPLLLASDLTGDEREYEIEMTNPDLDDGTAVPRDVIYVSRRQQIEAERLEVEVVLTSHHRVPISIDLAIDAASDWKDMFEVRGTQRRQRGKTIAPETTPRGLLLRYEGLDGKTRWTEVALEPAPGSVEPGELRTTLVLSPLEPRRLILRVRPGEGDLTEAGVPTYAGRDSHVRRAARRWREDAPRFRSSEPLIEQALSRATTDLGLMVTETEEGAFPYAGIPWYATPFGRDALVVALQLLPWRADVARGVLRYLAKRRARAFDDFTDAEPGKILHELREGEMAALREVPFIPYYGTVDATPLWLVLLEAHYASTGEEALVLELWDAAEDALGWLEGPGDADQDGLVEYLRRSPVGLRNQGWKDSGDAIHHASGELAEGPIALIEVQAYAYAARLAVARLLEDVRGDLVRAGALRTRAEEIRAKVERLFWDEELGTYVIALDGAKRPCRVASSNAAHMLWAGAATPWRARLVARRLFQPDMFSGYGIRTLATGSALYNPMSYHNGSIWPHDNAIVAEGLRRYGEPDRAAAVLRGLVDAAATFPLMRMPELFCGFPRRDDRGPVPYPVACSPQAWASGALLHGVASMLGIVVDAQNGRISFDEPRLPARVEWLEVQGIKVGSHGKIDVRVRRGARFFAVEVVEKEGDIEVVIRKRGPVPE
jgi:glycogen debranching enzyme